MNNTLARRIHQELRSKFVAGEFLPGTRLYEEKIAKEFDVSLTPVREAVKFLESEGLVVRQAHRALFARSFSFKEAAEVYEMRELLEPHAAALASRAADSVWLAEMKQLLEDQRQALHSAEFGQVQTLTASFHVRIAQCSKNRLLTDMIERLWLMVPLLRALAWHQSHFSRPSNVIEEHTIILDGIISGPEQAAQTSRDHVRSSWESVKEALEVSLPLYETSMNQ